MSTLDPKTRRVSDRYHRLLEEASEPEEWAYAWRSELNRGGFRAVDFLRDEVIDAGKCTGCAACVSICPVDVFDYVDERPVDTRSDACVLCVLCTEVCPILRPPDKDLPQLLDLREPAADEGFGPFAYALYARATRTDIRERAQDGGAVSALLAHAFAAGTIKGAVLGDTVPDDRQHGRHTLATSEDEVLACAGSRYTYSPNTLALREAMRSDVQPVAVVGVPCQIRGVRLEQNAATTTTMAAWYRKAVALTIGLFCSEAFTHESVVKLAEILEVPAERIAKINIKGKVVVTLDDGQVLTAPLARYREFARPACLYCLDYSAELADVGMGGIGIDGWTLLVVRTEAGHRFLQAALDDGWLETRPLADEPKGEQLLRKLSAEKKRNRPQPAKMPTLAERQELGCVDPKTFYTTGPGAP